MNIFDMFSLAARIATKRSDRRTFLIGAVGYREDNALVFARNEAAEAPNPRTHAEARLCRKLGLNSPAVYVARFSPGSMGFAMAKPCRNCERLLRNKKVKRVYFTISHKDWDYLDL